MKKNIAILFALLLIVAISLTYGKWELYTIMYNEQFKKAVEKEQEMSNTLLSSGIEKLKVLDFSIENAKVFLKDGTGNKWILNFKKDSNQNWTVRYNDLLNTEIVHSNMGGSANQPIYWY